MKTPPLTKETYDKIAAAAAGARVVAVTIAGHDLVLKAPPRSEWKRYRSMVLSDQKADASQTLVSACLLYPPHDIFQQIVESRPAVLDKVANKVAELAGLDDEVVEKNFGGSSSEPNATSA